MSMKTFYIKMFHNQNIFQIMEGDLKMKIRKILASLVAVSALAALASCGGGYSDEVLEQKATDDFSGYAALGATIGVGEGDNFKRIGDWAGVQVVDAGKMTAISLKKLSTLDETAAKKAQEGKVSGLYILEHVQLGTEQVKAGWVTNIVKDGEKVERDGGYCIKAVSYKHDADLDKYVTQGWFSSAENHCYNLTPSTLYTCPVKTPTDADEAKDVAGNDHNGNPAAINAGLYTFVVAKLDNKLDGCSYALGLIQEKELEGYDIAKPFPVTKMAVMGTKTSWDADKGLEMTKDANGNYTVSLDLEVDDQIKVKANLDWTFSWGFDALTAGKDNFDNEGGNIKIKTAGNYLITIKVPDPLSMADNAASVFTVEVRS